MKALASDIDGTLVFDQQIKKQDKEAIENSSLSKDVKKDKVRSLKNQYKQEKEHLKNERDAAIRSGVLVILRLSLKADIVADSFQISFCKFLVKGERFKAR